MFTGSFVYNVDLKGRVVMPAGFRAQLCEPFVLTRAPEHSLLALSLVQWEMLRRRYEHSLNFRAYYLSAAVECTLDRTTGRFLIPCVLREHAGLRRRDEAMVCGIGGGVLVLNRKRWEEQVAAGEFPSLGCLDLELDLPSPAHAARFRMETHSSLGFPLLRCSGRMHAKATRQFVGAVARALNAKPPRLWVDLREAGETAMALRLLECLPVMPETPIWLLGELPATAGVRVLPDLESAVWALGKGR